MCALQDKIEVKIKALASMYHGACTALLETHGEGDWMRHLKVLQDEDIWGISEWVCKDSEREDYCQAQEQAGVSADAIDDVLESWNAPTQPFNPVLSLGQSRYALSWIWYTHLSVVGTNDVGEGCSFEEIIDSLCAEWCKVQANTMCPAEELRLEANIGKQMGLSPWLEEGLSAYAHKHARVERDHVRCWSPAWFTVHEHAKAILRHVSNLLSDASLPAMPELKVEIEFENKDKFEEGDFEV
ncbi:hypothetical protein PQX77_021510 [Marasmius sp. AFHP31]|nr:hypothetical protein PQX77_021510 [Marasmius sp. AFHP31]